MNMRRGLGIASLILIIIGFTGFLGGALIASRVIDYPDELPWGDIEGFAVDTSGNVYIGLAFYGVVQSYSKEGAFIRHWPAQAGGGSFNLALDADQHIVLTGARGHKRVVFDQRGQKLEESDMDEDWKKEYTNVFTAADGARYRLYGLISPELERLSPEPAVLLDQGFLLDVMKGPMPAWLIAALGFGLNFFRLKYKWKAGHQQSNEAKS